MVRGGDRGEETSTGALAARGSQRGWPMLPNHTPPAISNITRRLEAMEARARTDRETLARAIVTQSTYARAGFAALQTSQQAQVTRLGDAIRSEVAQAIAINSNAMNANLQSIMQHFNIPSTQAALPPIAPLQQLENTPAPEQTTNTALTVISGANFAGTTADSPAGALQPPAAGHWEAAQENLQDMLSQPMFQGFGGAAGIQDATSDLPTTDPSLGNSQ